MKKIKLEDLSQDVIDKMQPQDRKDLGLKTASEIAMEFEIKRRKLREKTESAIQKSVEAYLVHLGYERRTPEDIQRGMPRSGFQIHLHNTRKNPILLDILVLSHTGRYLELELKTATGKLSAEQEALVAYGGSIARSAEEAMKIILDWHTDVSSAKPS